MKIIYFIAEYAPTPEEELEVLQLGFPVSQRNAILAAQESPEACDGVLGAVPENYRHLPDGRAVVEAQRKALLEAVAVRAKGSPVMAAPQAVKAPTQQAPLQAQPSGGPVAPGWATVASTSQKS
jgi:hypothetical protein